MSLKWHAVYTKPRWEKKVNDLLLKKGLESYCPLNKVRRRWSDRIKLVEEPLFKSYVFVRVAEENKTEVRMTNGVINFVYSAGKPAIVKDKEITAIRQFLAEYENVSLIAMELKPEVRVLVTAGALIDKEGKVIEVKHKTAKVLIESLGFMLIADIDKTRLIPVPLSQTPIS